MSIPVHRFRSSNPLVMCALPSDVNVPARAKKLPCAGVPHNSVPLIENAYWPFRLALVNFGGGGGGPPLLPPPPPPQPTASSVRKIETQETAHLRWPFIAHRLALSFARAATPAVLAPRQSREESHAASEWQELGSPFAPCAPKTRFGH